MPGRAAEATLARAEARRGRSVDWSAPLSAAAIALLATLVVLPMAWLAVTSVRDDAGRFTLAHYRQLVTDPAFVRPLLNTLWMSAAVGVACVSTAAPMAWLVSRTDLPAKRLLRVLVLASFVTPPFVGAFAWVLLGGPNAGLLNQWWYALRGLKPFEASPLVNVFSAWGVVFVMFLYTFPYVFTFVANALDAIPSELEEASAILGAPPWRTALEITLPLAAPALLGGFLVAFLQSITLFGVPAVLALPAGVDVLTTKIWSLFQFPPQLGLAAAASLPLLPVTVALLRGQRAVMGRRGYAVIGGKGGGARRMALGVWRIPALFPFAAVLGCSVALPTLVLLRTACVRNWAAPLTPANLSLEQWRFVFVEFSQTRLALQNTLVLGVTAATAATVLVTAIAWLGVRQAVWGHRALAFLATAPVAIPGVVLAVGLFLAYTRPPLVLYGTLGIIFLAYVTKELPVAFQQVSSSLRAVHPELEDASRILGATRVRTLVDVTAPLIRNGVIATWVFVFVGSIRELSATILLFTARTKTVSVTMFDLRESNDWGPIAVLCLTMGVITAALIAVVHRFDTREVS